MRGWKNMKSVKALFLLFSVLSLYYVLFLSSSISNSELNKEVPTEGKTQKSKLSNGEEPPSLTKELQSVGNIFVRADELEKEEQQVFELNKNVFDNNEVKGLCTRRPYPYEILFSNSYWQVLRIDGKINASNAYLYNAYLDVREKTPYVRILLETDRYYDKDFKDTPQFCQLWYPSKDKMVVQKVVKIESVFRWWSVGVKGDYHPFLLSCEVPSTKDGSLDPSDIPISVSLVMNECDVATNELKIVYEVPEKREDFGVCFKWIDFPTLDMSRRIVEMMELLKMMGVAGAHFPYLWSHPNIDKVLQYYIEDGYITVKNFTLPGFQPQLPLLGHAFIKHENETKIRQELTPYVDCFLTNMYRYKYIGILDLDEVVLSTKHENYRDLFKELEAKHKPLLPTSFCFDMKLFLDKMLFPNNSVMAEVQKDKVDDPDDPFFMTKLHYDEPVYCSANGNRNFKCYHSTEEVLVVSNHRPTLCLKKKDCFKNVKMSLAYTHHHKENARNCNYSLSKKKKDFINKSPFGYDDNILRFKDKVVSRRNFVMNSIIG